MEILNPDLPDQLRRLCLGLYAGIMSEVERPAKRGWWTVEEIASPEHWNCSRDFVIKKFENEPGVIVFAGERKRYKRTLRMLRIPDHVKARVEKRYENPEKK